MFFPHPFWPFLMLMRFLLLWSNCGSFADNLVYYLGVFNIIFLSLMYCSFARMCLGWDLFLLTMLSTWIQVCLQFWKILSQWCLQVLLLCHYLSSSGIAIGWILESFNPPSLSFNCLFIFFNSLWFLCAAFLVSFSVSTLCIQILTLNQNKMVLLWNIRHIEKCIKYQCTA